ncbi:MAG TPA: PQQ-binding-like beta-propeller repeat protein [Verrucomicrobiae bacterium]|nr:PQQ-binding-like beta-propeller repeat protein [Verrucomicrobiae bacterium]
MKIECSCGAKYTFEFSPEMRDHPVTFVCPHCGQDASEFVDKLVRTNFGSSAVPSGEPISIIPIQQAVPGLRLESAPGSTTDPPVEQASPLCSKHPGQVAIQKCYICSKPICPKCMDLFGYVCSPLCKAKADSHGITLPVFEGQKSRVEARRWRKLVWACSSAGICVAAALGLWFWYAWFGCAPRTIFSVRFEKPAYAGQSAFGGDSRKQIVFLHGGTLARYDLKSGKQIWSREILQLDEIQKTINRQMQANKALLDKANSEAWETIPKVPSQSELSESMERAAAAALSLCVRNNNIWVISPERLTRYSWESGAVVTEIPARTGLSEPIYRGNEIVLVNGGSGPPTVTRVDLSTGVARQEELAGVSPGQLEASAGKATSPNSPQPPVGMSATSPGADAGKPMDPSKVAGQAQRMSLAEKIALPATLAANMNQQRAMNELSDSPKTAPRSGTRPDPRSSFSLVPGVTGFVELQVKLLEANIVSRSAMKPGSGKSALEGEVTAGKSMELANDMLNEMQRNNAGDMIEEDHSRYEVTVRRPGESAQWTGEVIGPPRLYPLEHATVVAADKKIIVLDPSNHKLWESALAFNLPAGLNALDEGSASFGRGPCVEHKGTLYVFDEGVLSAFDLPTGNARWRLPSVGIAGIFLDDNDKLYVNTTTASHESLKYSRQIDLSRKVSAAVLKIDSRSGKILWSEDTPGLVSYVRNALVLTAGSFSPPESDGPDTGLEKPPWLRIRRLNPRDGREVWEYFQDRAPLDVAFDGNMIRLIFKKEVVVLRFPTF